jgi:hypothetical protein
MNPNFKIMYDLHAIHNINVDEVNQDLLQFLQS